MTVVVLGTASCGGGESADAPATTSSALGTESADAPDDVETEDSTPVGPVEIVAAAFVDSASTSHLALSLGPNDTGVDWIDVPLDADDQGTGLEVAAGDDRITIVGDDGRLSLWSQATGFWVDVQVGDDGVLTFTSEEGSESVDVAPSEPDAQGAGARVGQGDEFMTAAFRATPDEETPWTYMVDRPLSVTETVEVAVIADLDGQRIEPTGPTSWLPTVESCTGSAEPSVTYTCRPAADSISVRAEAPIPEETGIQGWKEGQLGVFASRKRCEQWRGFAGGLDRLVTTYGTAVTTWVSTKQPQIGLLLTGAFWVIDQTVMANISSVPCTSITVADELVEQYRGANAEFTVDLSVSATPLVSYSGGTDGSTLEFSTEEIALQPFADAAARTIVLTATDPAAAEAALTSGVWTGSDTSSTSSESRSSEYAGSATVELADGVYTVSYEITQNSVELGHTSCTSDTVTTGEASGRANDTGRILFEGEASVVTVSDCPFYESRGGRVEDTMERTLTAYLLDGNVLRLDLLPGQSFEMEWSEG